MRSAIHLNHFPAIVPVIGTLAGAFCAFYMAKTMFGQASARAQTTAEPFYLERSVSTFNMGNASPFKRVIVARRADGATARLESVGPLSANAPFVRRLTFLDGKSVSIFGSIKAKSTWPPMNQQEIDQMRERITAAPRDCGARPPGVLVRFDSVGGEDVAVLQHWSGKYRVTRWVAPALGCEDLYYRSETTSSDGSFNLSAEAKLERLVHGEPDPALFDTADGYAELKPSEAEARLIEQIGVDLGPDDVNRFKREQRRDDRLYLGTPVEAPAR
jgi:hypothetical protein